MPTSGSDVFYDFQLHSRASEDLLVRIVPTIQVIRPLPTGVDDPGLADLITMLDAAGGTITEVALPEGATRMISLRLALPEGVDGLRYSLRAMAISPDVQLKLESLPEQEVGQQSEQPDPGVGPFEFGFFDSHGESSFSTDIGHVSGVDGTLFLRQGTTDSVSMQMSFVDTSAGPIDYELSAEVQAPANGWSASVHPTTMNPIVVVDGGSVDSLFTVTAPASASTAIVEFSVTRQGTNSRRVVRFRLVTIP
jgi:hypothetical protein